MQARLEATMQNAYTVPKDQVAPPEKLYDKNEHTSEKKTDDCDVADLSDVVVTTKEPKPENDSSK